MHHAWHLWTTLEEKLYYDTNICGGKLGLNYLVRRWSRPENKTCRKTAPVEWSSTGKAWSNSNAITSQWAKNDQETKA
jgi:hypothetical protein